VLYTRLELGVTKKAFRARGLVADIAGWTRTSDTQRAEPASGF